MVKLLIQFVLILSIMLCFIAGVFFLIGAFIQTMLH